MPYVVTYFRDQWAFLSNFYPGEVEYEGDLYPTRENAYQAAKFPEWERSPFFSCTPGQAKRRGKLATLTPEWHNCKRVLMKIIVNACYQRNFILKQRLLNTGDAILEEGNYWGDLYWGKCLKTGRGSNHLGKINMELRDMYLRENFLRTLTGASSSPLPDHGASKRKPLA